MLACCTVADFTGLSIPTVDMNFLFFSPLSGGAYLCSRSTGARFLLPSLPDADEKEKRNNHAMLEINRSF
jgi:hypothetical protein